MAEKTIKMLGMIGGATVAVLGIAFTVYQTFHVPLAIADVQFAEKLACEVSARMEADAKIREDMAEYCAKASADKTEILVTLAEIKNDLSYIKKAVR